MNVLPIATADQLSIQEVIAAPYPYCLDLADPCEITPRWRSTTLSGKGRCNR